MKCGLEISDGQVFCEKCLTEMNQHPVASETKILLPNRPVPDAAKKQPQRKHVISPEEKIRRLQTLVKWLSITLVGTLLLLIFSVALLLGPSDPKDPQDNIGQNYNTVEPENSSN
jgi:hypothetical protein